MNIADYINLGKRAYDFFKDGIIILDSSCTIVYCNKSASRLFGYSPKEFQEKTLIDVAKPVHSIITCLDDKSGFSLKGIAVVQLEFMHKNKKKFIAPTFISNLGDKKLSPGYLIVLQDAVRAEQLKSSYVSMSMPYLRVLNIKKDDFFYISDLKTGRNIFCSDSVEKFLGWEAYNFVNGSSAFAISKTHPDDLCSIENFYEQRERWYKYPHKFDHIPQYWEYRMLHKQGYYVHVKASAMLLQRNKNKGPLYVITFGKTYQPKTQSGFNPGSLLTKREMQVLQQLKVGNSYKIAASELNISIDSVRTYIRRIYQKLNVHSVTEAIHKALLPEIKSL